MTREDIRKAVLRSLESVAPEVDASSIDPQDNLRDSLDIDSMDFLNFVNEIHDVLNVDVPEADYTAFDTVDGGVEYLAQRLSI